MKFNLRIVSFSLAVVLLPFLRTVAETPSRTVTSVVLLHLSNHCIIRLGLEAVITKPVTVYLMADDAVHSTTH